MRFYIYIICLLNISLSSFANEIFLDHFTTYATDNTFSSSYPQWSIETNNGTDIDLDIVRPSGNNNFSAIRFKISPMHTVLPASDVVWKRTFEATPGRLYSLAINGYALRQNDLGDLTITVKVISGDQEYSVPSLSLLNDRDNFQTSSVDFDLAGLPAIDNGAELHFEIGGNYQWIDIDYVSLSSSQYDADGDGLGDEEESNTYSTDPNDPDSDDDGLSDGLEINTYSTDPNDPDSDDDGLSDGDEVFIHLSNPNNIDTDADNLSDTQEVNVYGTNPVLSDSDSDGIDDLTEINTGSDPTNENDPYQQPSRFELLRYNENIDVLNREVLFQTLQDNQIIDINTPSNRCFNLRFYTIDSSPHSVRFKINDEWVRTDYSSPYYLEGNGGSWLPDAGIYTITAEELDQQNQIIEQSIITIQIEDALSHRTRKIRIDTSSSNEIIQLRMLKHAFPFGCVVQPRLLNDPWYQNTFLSNFNASVHENAMKWYSNQGYNSGAPNYSTAENMYNFLNDNGIPMRGHTFFWGMDDGGNNGHNSQMWDPNWVENEILSNQQAGLNYIEQRARSVASFWKGRIDEWDFNNEMGHGDWYRDLITGTSPEGMTITKQMVNWAMEENPNLKVYHNDYGILPDRHFAFSFYCLLKRLKNEGVPIDGIGIQGHFENHPPDQEVVQTALDTLDDFGVPIKITEFDCAIGSSNNNNETDEQAEADGLEVVYRTAFEHPAVEGILAWGFWQQGHWRPAAAFYRTNKEITLQGERYRQLVFDEWWSNVDLLTNQDGYVSGTIFAGDYEINLDGTTHTVFIPAGYKTANLIINNNGITVNLDPEIKLAKPVHNNRYSPLEIVEMELQLIGDTSQVNRVEFYVGEQLIKTDTSYPYTAGWDNPSIGSHLIWSKCLFIDGEEESTSTNQIEILSPQVIGDTILSDSGFENSNDGWTSIGNDIGQGGVTEITSLRSRGGQYSLLTRNRNADWHGPMSVRNLHNLMQEGMIYQFSCYAQVGSGSERVQIQMKEKKVDQPVETYTTIGHGRCNDSQWTYIDGYIRASDLDDIDEMFIYINSPDRNIDIYIDDVVLRSVPENILDIDLDGINDVWEQFYTGNLTEISDTSDIDGDNTVDLIEFRSGTLPTDASSFFKPNSSIINNSQIMLTWNTVLDQKYRILKTDNLNNSWQVVEENIQGNNDELMRNLSTTNTQEFIRIKIDR